MAPEILRKKKYDEKVDVWSIGVIAFMLLSGEMLFSGKQTQEITEETPVSPIIDRRCGHLSDNGKDFLKKCLDKNSESRWSCE